MEKICNKCRTKCDGTTKIAYAAHEGAINRKERTIRWLLGIVLVLIIMLVSSNAGWIIHHKTNCQHTTGVHLFETN